MSMSIYFFFLFYFFLSFAKIKLAVTSPSNTVQSGLLFNLKNKDIYLLPLSVKQGTQTTFFFLDAFLASYQKARVQGLQ